MPEKLTSKDLLAICLFALISFVLAFYYESNQIVSGDQLQMIEKGYHALMTGEFLPYGNEASTVGIVIHRHRSAAYYLCSSFVARIAAACNKIYRLCDFR